MSKSTESFYKRLKKQLEISNKWPSQYKFKFIIKSEKSDENKLVEIFKDLDPKIDVKKSSTNKFKSFTIVIESYSPDQIIEIYKLASEINGIISL